MTTIRVALACAVLLAAPARAATGQTPPSQSAPSQSAPTQTPPASSASAPAAALELRKGDRIALVGNTLAERMQYFNHFEARLMTRFPDLELTVRNLGWSGDTITLQPRPLNFGDAKKHLTEQKADVILAFFGLNESFDGDAGLAAFEKDLDAYLKTHLAARYNGTTAPRVALISPIAHEKVERLVHVDAEARNRELARYTEAMRGVAGRNGVAFVDLFTPTRQAMASATTPLTINGLHVTEDGDRLVAGLLMAGLGFDPASASSSASAPAAAAAADTKQLDALRETIRDKNEQFLFRFRPVNAEYVVGRRVDPFGSVNFPPEMRQLDQIVSERDRRIWKQARAVRRHD